jgi:hypothetical protein
MTKASTPIAATVSIVSRRLSPLFRLLRRRLERQAGPRRVLEEHVADGAPAQRRHLRVGPGVDLDHVVGQVEEASDGVKADLGDRTQVLHEITTPSPVA